MPEWKKAQKDTPILDAQDSKAPLTSPASKTEVRHSSAGPGRGVQGLEPRTRGTCNKGRPQIAHSWLKGVGNLCLSTKASR